MAEGAVELLANGSGFLRLASEPTDDDVYISAAQIKRCELVSGDRIAGPVRPPRRSERFPSLIRVDTINGRPADEVAEGTHFEDMPVAWPSSRIQLGSEDPTVKAIEWLTPFGRGSRVVIAGPSRSGKSEALRRLAEALAGVAGLEVSSVLIGVRPEEIADWTAVVPGAALSFSASSDAQAQAVEQAVELGRRVAARGGDAVVLIDTLEYLPAAVARRALAAGRNLAGGGSLTVIATAPAPVGGETTVVVLDRDIAAAGTFPALALRESGTLRPELLVGEAGTAAIRAAGGDAPEPVVVPEPEPEAAVVVIEPEPVAKPAAKRSRAKPKAKPAAAAKAPARRPRRRSPRPRRGGGEAQAGREAQAGAEEEVAVTAAGGEVVLPAGPQGPAERERATSHRLWSLGKPVACSSDQSPLGRAATRHPRALRGTEPRAHRLP